MKLRSLQPSDSRRSLGNLHFSLLELRRVLLLFLLCLRSVFLFSAKQMRCSNYYVELVEY